ncbi:MAG: hypothetical protein J5767_07350 [Paludibacteraceae bacterium]|nr:hypothetical protein [Paludibacteraceae bacterium]
MMNTSYRPRNPGHDYYGKGVYLITLVVRGREPLIPFTSNTFFYYTNTFQLL